MKVLRVSDAFLARVDGVLASLEADLPSTQLLRRIPMDVVAMKVAEHGSVTDAQIRARLIELFERNIMPLPLPVVMGDPSPVVPSL